MDLDSCAYFRYDCLLVAVPAMRQSSGDALQSVLLVVIIVIPIAVLMFRQGASRGMVEC